MKACFAVVLLLSSLWGVAFARPGVSHAATSAVNVTREQFTVALAQQLHLPAATSAKQVFSDLPPSDPAFGLIMAAYEAGWISGYQNGTFQPGAFLTREQVAKSEVLALGLGAQAAALAGKKPTYADAGWIGKWAWGYVNEAQAIDILHGFSTDDFGPASTFTQAEIVHARSQLAAYLTTTAVKPFPATPTATPGSAAGTSAIQVTPLSAADAIAVQVSAAPLSLPEWDASPPGMAVAYSPGQNLPVKPDAYVGVYEVAQGHVVAFSQLQVASSDIAEPPAGLSLKGPSQGAATAAANIGPYTLQLLDKDGNPAPAPAGGETIALGSNSVGTFAFALTSSGAAVSTVTVPAGQSQATFYYGDTQVGLPVLLASSTSLGSATTDVQISAGAPAKLALTGPATGSAGGSADIGPFTLVLTDAYGNPSPAPAGGVTAELSSNASGASEFSLTSGGAPLSSVTIPQGQTVASFYYGNALGGSLALTALSQGLESATLSLLVGTSATELTVTGPQADDPSSTATDGPFTVTLAGTGGQPIAAPTGGVAISLSSSSTGSYEFSQTSGGPAVTGIAIPAGNSSATFYYGDTAGGTPILTASSAGLQSGTIALEIISATATGLTIKGPATGYAASSAVNGPYTVVLADASGQPVPAPAGGIAVSLASNSSGVHEFAQSAGGQPVTTVVIPAGSSSATFYYGDSQPGVVALVASGGSFTPASAQLEIAGTVNLTGTGLDSPTSPATAAQVQGWVAQGMRNLFLNTFVPGFAQQYATALPSMNVVLFQGYWTSAFTGETGAQRAQEAIRMAKSVGYPRGAYIFVDVESTGTATAQQMVTWINSWAQAVQSAGYGAGVYFGVPQPVTAAQTASLLTDRFWKSFSGTSITPAPRGVCVVQTGTNSYMDTDMFQTDNLGEYCIGAGL